MSLTALQEQVLAVFEDPMVLGLNEQEIARAMGRTRRPAHFSEALEVLVEDGRLMRQGEDYLLPEALGYAAGTYWGGKQNYGFVTPDGAVGRGSDLFLPPHCSGRAWQGDRVLVVLDGESAGEGRRCGRVVKIIRRGNSTVIGRLDRLERKWYVIPDSGALPALRLVQPPAGFHQGEKVMAQVLTYGDRRQEPTCRVVTSFGKDGTRQAAVESILCQNDISRTFPQEVLEAAGRIPDRVTAAARRGREDLRDRCIITIDGASARDLDDAVSLKRREDGLWELGVHIADVSHYVRGGSPLDQEALKRGTSVYFADQVVPMLPVALSNGICSLNPQVDRLTLSCIMTLDRRGRVTEHRICKSVICTTERMTYDDCNTLLAGGDCALEERYRVILPMLRQMAELARVLERNRSAQGALELETQECVLVCDEAGSPVGAVPRVSGQSEKIIESFMIAANETVAEQLTKLGKPGVYRIHEKPGGDKLTSLRATLAPLGYTLESEDALGMQKLLRQVKGTEQAPAVAMALLRSMMKARYEDTNLGHFGLGAEYYCHFTSPIRRYPDLMVHRILTAVLEGSCHGGGETRLRKAAAEAAMKSSQRERAAEQAERDIEKCYAAELMLGHIGEEYSGMISGVTANRLFVLLPGGIEGSVDVEWLPRDIYEYDEEARTLTGVRRKRMYTFARTMTVKVLSADPGTGRIELQPTGEDEGGMLAPAGRKRVTRQRGRGASQRSGGRPMHVPKKGKGGRRKGRGHQ